MVFTNRAIILLILLALTNLSAGQELVHWKIGQNEGLPSNTIYFIFQDNQGYFWITTEEGLFKYNGKRFVEIPTTGLKGKSMGQLVQDKKGRIWAKTFTGEILFIKNDSIHALNAWNKLAKPGFPEIAVKGDSLIITSTKSAYYFDEDADTIIPLLPYNKFNYLENIWTLEAKDGIKIIASQGKDIIYIKEKQGNWESKRYIGKEHIVGNHQIITWKDRDYLYQSFKFSATPLDIVDSPKELFPPELKKNEKWLAFHNLGDTLFALNSFNGTYLCKEGKVIHHLLPGIAVSALTIDVEGNIWIGTLRNGIYIIPSLSSYNYSVINTNDSKKITPYRICPAGNELQIGTFDGKIIALDSEGKQRILFDTKNKAEVQSIYFDSIKKHTLFFCKEFYEIDLKGKLVRKSQIMPPVKQMIRIKDSYFLATSFGLVEISCEDLSDKKRIYPSYRFSSIGYDPIHDEIYAGSQKGFLFGPINGTEEDFKEIKSLSKSQSIGATRIISCKSGKIYVSTTNDGLLLLEKGKIKSQWKPLGSEATNHFRSLSFYKNGLIFCSNNLIFHLDTISDRIFKIDETKGLNKSEIYDIIGINQAIFLATSEGVQRFDQLPKRNIVSPRVVIEKIQSNERIISTDSHYIFPFSENRLEFNFSALPNISSRGNLKIKYRLKGLEDNWNETDMNSPFALYPSIPAGKYSFEILAMNEDGITSSEIEKFDFEISAPFYQRWWFYVCLSLIIGTIVAFIFLFRIRQIRKNNMKEMERQRLFHQLRISQLTSIRSQMNPHFIFNTMSTIQSKVMEGNKDGAFKQIGEFSKLMRKVLDISSSETMSVKEEYDLIKNYLDLEKERLGSDFSYQLKIDEEIDAEFIRIPSLITLSYIENALRHGLLHKQGKKSLTIDFEIINQELSIKITDNGIGRKRSGEINKIRNKDHKSFATDAYARRIELLNKMRKKDIRVLIVDLFADNNEPTGTQVLITIPEE